MVNAQEGKYLKGEYDGQESDQAFEEAHQAAIDQAAHGSRSLYQVTGMRCACTGLAHAMAGGIG
jgi:hypothetical protein